MYIRYAVRSFDGAWTHEVVVAPDAFAELRTRRVTGTSYAFGCDAQGAWLRVAGGEALDAPILWDQEARTQTALFGLRFIRPGEKDEVEYIGRSGRQWEFAFRQRGGRTITFGVDSAGDVPKSYDSVDDFVRLVTCDKLRWKGGRRHRVGRDGRHALLPARVRL